MFLLRLKPLAVAAGALAGFSLAASAHAATVVSSEQFDHQTTSLAVTLTHNASGDIFQTVIQYDPSGGTYGDEEAVNVVDGAVNIPLTGYFSLYAVGQNDASKSGSTVSEDFDGSFVFTDLSGNKLFGGSFTDATLSGKGKIGSFTVGGLDDITIYQPLKIPGASSGATAASMDDFSLGVTQLVTKTGHGAPSSIFTKSGSGMGGFIYSPLSNPDYYVNMNGHFDLYAVPEPSTWALFLVGIGAIGGALRLSRRSQGAVALG